ncbi:MAG: transglutaminase domain-containing protein [Verrucomicrobia bacterium]|nr:transglutaminase domain-containing protein [Verrucomicrobiota bacterium]
MASQPTPPKKPAPILAHRRSQTNWPLLLVGGAALAGVAWFVWQNTRRPTEVVAVKETPKPVEAPKAAAPEPVPVVVAEPKPVAPVAPPKMAEVPKEAPAAAPVVVEARPFVFAGAALNDPKLPALLVADARERLKDGQWEEHLTRLRKGLLPALAATASTDGVERHNRLWESRAFALGMTQALFIRRVGAENLRTAAQGGEPLNALLGELLGRADLLEKFALTLKDEDDAAEALRVWARLAADDTPAQAGRYDHLQIACALVFDQPLRWSRFDGGEACSADALTRYRYFKAAAEAGRLVGDVRKASPGDLVWVVGATATEEEMNWALANPKLRSLSEWAPSYGLIRYRMDYVTQEKTKLAKPTEGTLKEIFELGGICMHQAHFAANTARAYGIPAAYVTGDGNRGGHAWFAYQRKDKEWNMNTGRYNDGYACGETTDPQTGRRIGEFEVQILGDPQRRAERFAKSQRLQLAAQIFGDGGDREAQRECLRLAVLASNRCLEAWRAYAACLEALGPKVRTEEWKTFVQEMRRAFDEWPDMRELADEMEAKHLYPTMTQDEIFLSCKRAYDRLISEKKRRGDYDRTRYDLIQKAVGREAAVLMADRARHAEKLANMHRRALEDNADHLPTFRALLEGYYQAVKGDSRMEAAFLSEIERVYRRKLGGTAGADVFRLKALAGLLDLIQGYFEKCDDVERARRLRLESEKIQKTLDKLKK